MRTKNHDWFNCLDQLSLLNLEFNKIEDLQPLVDNPGIGKNAEIYLNHNPLSEEAINKQIPELQERGAKIHFRK